MANDDRYLIVGLQGSGKTYYTKNLIQNELRQNNNKRVLVLDIMEEYSPKGKTDIYRPKNKAQPINEAELCIKRLINDPKRIKGKCAYSMIVIDETGQYYPNKSILPPEFALINHTARHIPLKLVFITRRISQIHTDLSELSSKLIIFRQTGINDIKRLNEISAGLGDAASQLKDHRYIEVEADRTFKEKPPISI